MKSTQSMHTSVSPHLKWVSRLCRLGGLHLWDTCSGCGSVLCCSCNTFEQPRSLCCCVAAGSPTPTSLWAAAMTSLHTSTRARLSCPRTSGMSRCGTAGQLCRRCVATLQLQGTVAKLLGPSRQAGQACWAYNPGAQHVLQVCGVTPSLQQLRQVGGIVCWGEC